ncbi:lytic polysaccharide monooxygenase [Lentzea sp. BCCO 10_0061]|uniref:Lytic polysaccharide monooxygenase n=1 Tax=Lentzea sokolovensis TaxID=3095429 RepID=A0ABU4UWF7_9PSEU|nr:lytic polysaccharide monooxygenase [Lentzea sp. BCCO 10_0061]MDX8143086.1 lytic polysaccharide monooxygenase [Lentzea sp. BCCO 10_0061]
MKIMRKAALLIAAVPAIVLITPVGSASAHGYVSSPASRSAQCARGDVSVDLCGQAKYEPQSAEGPKGLKNCSGATSANSPFAPLDNDSLPWKVTNTGQTLSLTWTFTARHATRDYEYFIGGTRVGYVAGNNQQPNNPTTHTINLGGFSGRQKLYAIWNISDTVNAFYSCIDLNINGGGTTPPPTTTTTTPPPTTTSSSTTTPPPAGGTWAANTSYATGQTVTYGGSTYRCRQAHTSLTGWEPPNVAALWEKI